MAVTDRRYRAAEFLNGLLTSAYCAVEGRQQFTVRAGERELLEGRSRKPASAVEPARVMPFNLKEKRLQRNPVARNGVSNHGQRDERLGAQAEVFAKDIEWVGAGTPHLDARELPKMRIDGAVRTLADEELIAMLQDESDDMSLACRGARAGVGQLGDSS